MVANGHVYPEADQFGGGSTYRQRLLLHHGDGLGAFTEEGADDAAIARPGTGRGLATGDIDNDGRVDVLINEQDAPPRLLLNRNSGGHWLQVALRGTRSNRDAVGALATVTLSGPDPYSGSIGWRQLSEFKRSTASLRTGKRHPSGFAGYQMAQRGHAEANRRSR